ncbi:HAD family hydrolase [Leucobacter ruminantium]|uniref:phosphoserine phosphatase n=1 Tax=Leucobacter ruminantium TaxID=1289170 RepID=A0A939RUA4_9MICO|nr:HAD family hydrolase [Leucobacter ruminantium]MBO1805490.1 haloacid dehalogenase-like hydrolase [Leucobacter ruminantium]
MPHIARPLIGLAAAAVFASGLTACSAPSPSGEDEPAEATGCRTLDEQVEWPDEARTALDELLTSQGACAGDDAGNDAPVAIFDWDNTVVKNDIGYGTNYWMLNNDKILQPEGQDWGTTSRYLTPAAVTALGEACGTETPAGEPLPTSTDTACADEIVAVLDGETTGGEEAFDGYDARRINAAYAWSAALLAGYTPEEAQDLAAQAKEELLAADEGASWTVGTTEVDGYVHVYEQIDDLIGAMHENGIEPWIVSASSQPVVLAWSDEVGIDAEHSIGVRNLLDGEGRITAHLEGCGDIADGEDAVMTYIDGKRCWANQEIFGITGAAAFEQAPADVRQIFGAGDSDTDVTFMEDATELRLVINRNKTELMCRALDNEDGKWVVVPMFIDPKEPNEEGYACSTEGRIEPDGGTSPLKRADGSVVEDQSEAV